jgi:hypothetical protein
LQLDSHVTKQKLQVSPSGLLHFGFTQEIGRVIGDKDLASAIGMELTSQSSHAKRCVKQSFGGDQTEANNVFRLDDFELPYQVFATVLDFSVLWISITWGTAFDCVEDKDVFAFEPAGFDHLGEQLPGAAHEGASSRVFFGTGSFTHEANTSDGTAFAGHRVFSLTSERFTFLANRNFGRDFR